MELPKIVRRLAAEEAIRNQQEFLEQTIGRLFVLARTLPESEIRDRLFDEMSALDVIATVTKQTPNSLI